MLEINCTFKKHLEQGLYTPVFQPSSLTLLFSEVHGWRSSSDMFRGVLNTKKQLCSRSNMVEMVCSYADIVTENTNITIQRTLFQITPSTINHNLLDLIKKNVLYIQYNTWKNLFYAKPGSINLRLQKQMLTWVFIDSYVTSCVYIIIIHKTNL